MKALLFFIAGLLTALYGFGVKTDPGSASTATVVMLACLLLSALMLAGSGRRGAL